jgi:hypothetical protein
MGEELRIKCGGEELVFPAGSKLSAAGTVSLANGDVVALGIVPDTEESGGQS